MLTIICLRGVRQIPSDVTTTYVARIGPNGDHFLGFYGTAEDAAVAYARAVDHARNILCELAPRSAAARFVRELRERQGLSARAAFHGALYIMVHHLMVRYI